MKNRFLAVMFALVMTLMLVPTVVMAQGTGTNLTGFCGGDTTAEKNSTISDSVNVYGVDTLFSIDIYENVKWRLDKNENAGDTYTLTLTGSGIMADYRKGSVRPWINYASKITKLVVGSGVTSVGSRTCYGFTNLTEVSLADTVTDIGDFSFSGCTELTSIDLSNVTSIRASAVRDNPSLSNIKLSSALKTIGWEAFRNSGAEGSTIEIPESVTEIGYNAFCEAKFTNVLNLPNVTKVGAYAFSDSKFAAVVLTNAGLEITTGKEESSGNEKDNGVFSNVENAVFYTSVPEVMNKLYDGNRYNNKGIIACTNGGTFSSDTEFSGYKLAVPQKNGYVFGGWFSDKELTKTEGLTKSEDGAYTGEPTTEIEKDGRRYYAKWEKADVEFLPGGGSGVMSGANLDNENTLTFPKCDFTAPADKEFAGWKITKPEGDDTLYRPEETKTFTFAQQEQGGGGVPVTDNKVIVTAQWKEKPQQPIPDPVNPDPINPVTPTPTTAEAPAPATPTRGTSTRLRPRRRCR